MVDRVSWSDMVFGRGASIRNLTEPPGESGDFVV
jgi:hypothetical protein